MVLGDDEFIILPSPSAIEELKEWLAFQGFALVEQEDDLFFGDRRLRWARNDMRIQVSLDRGRWFVDIIPAWFEEWMGYGLEIIVDTLADTGEFTHLLTLADSVRILKDMLPEISALIATQEGCTFVEDMGRERAHRWFGA